MTIRKVKCQNYQPIHVENDQCSVCLLNKIFPFVFKMGHSVSPDLHDILRKDNTGFTLKLSFGHFEF